MVFEVLVNDHFDATITNPHLTGHFLENKPFHGSDVVFSYSGVSVPLMRVVLNTLQLVLNY